MSGTDRATGLVVPEEPYRPLLETTDWLARRYRLPFSEAAVLGRLPAGGDPDDPALLGRALSAVGLKSKLARRDVRRLDPAVLPCVVWRKAGGMALLLRFADGQRTAVITQPGEDGLEREVPLRKIRRETRPEVLLVTPKADSNESRMSPEGRDAAEPGHWLWRPVAANWAGWTQILVAALCLNLLNLALPLFVMNVYDRVIPNLAFVTLWTLAGGVVIALALDAVLRTLRADILERIGRRVDLRASAKLFSHAMRLRLLDRPGGAAGIANVIRDFESVRDFFASATFVALIDLLFIGVFIAVLFVIVGPIAWVPLLAVPAVIVLALVAQLPMARAAKAAQRIATKRHTVLVETMSGIETVKSLGAEPAMQGEWENAVAAASRVGATSKFWSTIAMNGTLLVQQAVSVVIIVWGVFLVAEGRITIGGLIAANILAGRVLAPLAAISQTILRAQHAFKSMAALNRLMAQPTDGPADVAGDLRVTEGRLILEKVTLRYPGAAQPALNVVSLTVAPGDRVALLGRVGSGKSSLGRVVAGLVPPDSGAVLIDGKAVTQYDPAELRAGVGYLPQVADLFTGTLRENLTLGRTGVSDAQIFEALRYAGIEALVSELPDGLQFDLGERGVRLSGGQRQAVSLARLLLRRPRLLFLDEPTNAMDQQMEATVTSRLSDYARDTGAALILSTHRQAVIDAADRIVVLEKGAVVLDAPKAEALARLQSGADVARVGE
ncbi:MAG: type I secretion system permease/ATPase [Pseudomonadota bacterium]